jgi:hypothetical protein
MKTYGSRYFSILVECRDLTREYQWFRAPKSLIQLFHIGVQNKCIIGPALLTLQVERERPHKYVFEK